VDNNQPVRKAQVRLTAPATRMSRTTTSDENDRFSFDNLPAGDYAVVASKPGYLDMVFGARRPGPHAASAAPVRVGLTEEVPGIDMKLQVIQTATVSLRVTSTEPVIPQTRLQLFDATMPVNIVGIWFRDMRADGTFSFPGLVPGSDVLKGAGTPGGQPGMAGGEMWGTVDVAVGGRGTANVTLPMQRGVTVSGR
jgi:hypothetical protein